MADGDQWPGLAQREAVMESIPSEDERVLFGMIFALEASDNHRKAVGGVEPRGGRVATVIGDGLTGDEPLDEIPRVTAALRPSARVLSQIGLSGMGGDGVDRIECESRQRQPGVP